MRRSPQPRKAKNAFTLVEILLVMVILAVIASISVKVGLAEPRLQAAMAQCQTLVNRARLTARSQSAETRLLIAAEPDRPQDFLRVLLVAHLEDTDPRQWRVTGPPLRLPDSLRVDLESCMIPPHRKRLPSMKLDLRTGLERGQSYAFVSFAPTGLTPQAGTPLIIGEGRYDQGRVTFKGDHRKTTLLLQQTSQTLIE